MCPIIRSSLFRSRTSTLFYDHRRNIAAPRRAYILRSSSPHATRAGASAKLLSHCCMFLPVLWGGTPMAQLIGLILDHLVPGLR
jgi:hypothetical protein